MILIRHREIKKISDGKKLLKLLLFETTILSLKSFMNRDTLKNDTMNESDLQRVYNYEIYPRDSKIVSDKGFVKFDNGSIGGTHGVCFMVTDNKSYYKDSSGGTPDNFLLNQSSKRKIYHNLKKSRYKFKIMWLILLILFLFY